MWSNRTVQDGDGNRAIHQSRLTGRTRWVSRCTTGLAGPPRWNSNSMASACSLGVAMARRIHHCPFGARHRVQTATGGCMVSGSGPSSMAKVPPCVTRDCKAKTACSRTLSSKTYWSAANRAKTDWNVPAGGSLNVPTTNWSPGWDRRAAYATNPESRSNPVRSISRGQAARTAPVPHPASRICAGSPKQWSK